MLSSSQPSDKSVLQLVTQKMASTGSSGRNRVSATIKNGDVTLLGTIQFEHHRTGLVRAVGSVRGVRRVIDQIKITPREKQTGK